MDLEACLPSALQGPSTTIARVRGGLSGAGVYRVDAGGQAFVLKIAREDEPVAGWRRRLQMHDLAGQAGLAPRVVHSDEERRAVLSAFVVDQSFPAFYARPDTRAAAIEKLGRTLARVHELPLPAGAPAQEPRELLAALWSGLPATYAVPAFVGTAVRRVLTEEAPAQERADVFCHNDVNPTNLAYDGEHVMLLDWDTAGPNDPLYDLAAIAMFLRMDEGSCRALLEAHDGAPVSSLPARFLYGRRLVAVVCGVLFLRVARGGGHAGATGDESLESTTSLGDLYARMRTGALDVGAPDGQWAFGLALVKESTAL